MNIAKNAHLNLTPLAMVMCALGMCAIDAAQDQAVAYDLKTTGQSRVAERMWNIGGGPVRME